MPQTRHENYGRIVAAPFSPLLKITTGKRYRTIYVEGEKYQLEKMCSKCENWFAADTRNFLRIKRAASWWYLYPYCRKCANKIKNAG